MISISVKPRKVSHITKELMPGYATLKAIRALKINKTVPEKRNGSFYKGIMTYRSAVPL